jgi:hypothetical protein
MLVKLPGNAVRRWHQSSHCCRAVPSRKTRKTSGNKTAIPELPEAGDFRILNCDQTGF